MYRVEMHSDYIRHNAGFLNDLTACASTRLFNCSCKPVSVSVTASMLRRAS